MNKIKKLLKKSRIKTFLGLGLATPLTMAALLAGSCSAISETTITDVSKISTVVESRKAEILAANNDETKHFHMNLAIVTADGKVNDNSFNQSSWEAIRQFAKLTDSETKPIDSATSDLQGKYNALINTNSNVWVLSGFQHYDAVKAWLGNAENKKMLQEKKIIIIGIDWPAGENDVPQGHLIRLNYKTEEAAWIAGYANASFLAQKFPNDANKRSAISVGGGAFPSVTDFIAGYLTGIKAFNTESNSKKTKITDDKINISTGFAPNATAKVTLENLATNGSPTTLLAVAGPLTSIFSDFVKDKNDRYLIGVDTDQSLIYTESKAKFFTSIEKRLGESVFNVLTDLYTKKQGSQNLGEFSLGAKNAFVKLGYKNKFVGVSDSSLEGNDKVLADKALSEAKAKFEEKTKNKSGEEIRTTLSIPAMSGDQAAELTKLVKEINELAKTSSTSNPSQMLERMPESDSGETSNTATPSGGHNHDHSGHNHDGHTH
ncbi:BMP family ABC transporter substrate-binding protein [Mycoplasma sp. 'Moose RK']|uniref:BMP family ABC transporter substrate-binding protein n=1 Tax=Mycoplasma sp. 'Moose RK' TaxID=2780095 RepID=UPI0018C21231|nr:BMP family ABC transporter substrate-binding protein [Mycoplasma sp. 'Moose RK']MBG0730562.1 BMP family protein [Mycoplasma sp. 'Moose RK']